MYIKVKGVAPLLCSTYLEYVEISKSSPSSSEFTEAIKEDESILGFCFRHVPACSFNISCKVSKKIQKELVAMFQPTVLSLRSRWIPRFR